MITVSVVVFTSLLFCVILSPFFSEVVFPFLFFLSLCILRNKNSLTLKSFSIVVMSHIVLHISILIVKISLICPLPSLFFFLPAIKVMHVSLVRTDFFLLLNPNKAEEKASLPV